MCEVAYMGYQRSQQRLTRHCTRTLGEARFSSYIEQHRPAQRR